MTKEKTDEEILTQNGLIVLAINNTHFVEERVCKEGLSWDARRNGDIIGDNMLFVRKDHLGFVTEVRIGKEL